MRNFLDSMCFIMVLETHTWRRYSLIQMSETAKLSHFRKGDSAGETNSEFCIWCIWIIFNFYSSIYLFYFIFKFQNDTPFITIDQGNELLNRKKDWKILMFSLLFSVCFHLRKPRSNPPTLWMCYITSIWCFILHAISNQKSAILIVYNITTLTFWF